MKRLFQSLGRRFRRLRIKRKVLLVYLTVGFLPFALFTIFLYGHTRHLIIDSEYGVRQSALNQAVQAVDATLEMYNTMSNYMFNEPSVLSALNRTYGDDYYAMYESYRDVITPVFNTHAALYPDLKRITIYTSCDILPYNTYVRDKSLLESAGWFMPLAVDYSPQWITLTQDAQTRLVCIRRIGMPWLDVVLRQRFRRAVPYGHERDGDDVPRHVDTDDLPWVCGPRVHLLAAQPH